MFKQMMIGMTLFSALAMGCGSSTTTPAKDMATAGADMTATPADMTATADLTPVPDLGPAAAVAVGNGGTNFSPQNVTIKAGQAVQWTWAAAGHNVVSGTVVAGVATPDNKFCSPADQTCATAVTSAAGTVYVHTFATAGSYPYFCKPHAGAGMTGTITVQ